jgi:hypothetical protein
MHSMTDCPVLKTQHAKQVKQALAWQFAQAYTQLLLGV